MPVTGKMPVPLTEEKERASFYLFMSQLCNAILGLTHITRETGFLTYIKRLNPDFS